MNLKELAEMICRFDESEGLSPPALWALKDFASKALAAQLVALSYEQIIAAFEPHIDSEPTAPHDMPTYWVRQDELIAHIDTKIAAAFNEGAIEGRIHQRGVDEAKLASAYERGYDDGHIAGRDKGKRASTEEAHAEGRRSAMEELQPKIAAAFHEGHSEGAQWQLEAARTNIPSLAKDDPFAPDDDSNKDVKEAYQQGRAFATKELEAKLEAAARDKDGNHVDDLRGWLDEAKEQYEAQDVAFQACSLKLQQAEAALAARQAPDLSDNQIMALWTQCNMPSEENDFITGPLPFARALLAQPLQQEGGKVSLPKPERQKEAQWLPEIGEDVLIRHGRDNDDHLCTVIGYEIWPALGGNKFYHRILVHVVYKGTEITNARHLHELRAAPHPSDNLQQASTAQAEPAVTTEMWAELGKMKFDVASTHYNLKAIRARYLPDTAQATPEGIDYLAHAGGNKALAAAMWSSGWKPATPEKTDLPMLPDIDRDVFWVLVSALKEAKPGAQYNIARNALVAHINQHCRDYARAALAATTAAEPVAYYTRDRKMLAFADFIKPEFRGDMIPLYRAAPPQQVDTSGLPG